jgi:uncharacterized RDD family membrane protein YckC
VTKIKITTTQNIDIEYELATLFDRILAWLIDFAILVGYAFFANLVVYMFDPYAGHFAHLAAMAPGFMYHFFMEWFLHGLSVGKMAMGLRVMRIDGSPPNILNYFMRWMFRVVETNLLLLYGIPSIVAIAFSPKSQRIGDMLTGTTVVRIDRKTQISDTILVRAREGYQPVFPGASKLSDRDIHTVRDVIALYRQNNDRKVLIACANRVAHVLHLEPPAGMTPDIFLRTIMRDYSQMS